MDIVTLGNDKLQTTSELITDINDELIFLIEKMFVSMYQNNGIGLAAIQVGIPKRLFIADVPGSKKVAMINPVIKEQNSDLQTYEEGCLSIPGILADVQRPSKIVVEYTDEKGKTKHLKAKGLLATCIQHEIDHLDGVLFVDRIDPELRLQKIQEFKHLQKRLI